MKFKSLKKAAAFVTAVFMMLGMLTVFPEGWFSQISLLVSAEESDLYLIKTEQVCNNAQFTINSITMCAASEGFCKMNVTITKSEDVEWTNSEGLYICIYGKKPNQDNYTKIGGIVSTSFGSSTLSFMVDGPDETSPLETYSEIYFDCGYGHGNSNTEIKNSFVSCTRIYMSTSAPQEDTDEDITYNGHKYELFDESMTWTEAKAYCENLGGHLVTINSADEQAFITSLTNSSSKKNIWLGAELVNNNYVWITNEEFSYTNWASGEPNNVFAMQNTIMMYTKNGNGTAGTWNDESKEGRDWSGYRVSETGFVCEWDSGSSTEETDPIEIDVQFLDKDKNPIDTIEYKRGEINLKQIRILVKNNSNKDYIVDENSDEYLAVGISSIENQHKDGGLINWIADNVVYKTDSLLRGQTQIYEIDVTTNSIDELLTNELTFDFNFTYTDSNGTEESILQYKKKYKVKSDVFNLINGDYNGTVNKKILSDYLYKDNKALDYFYKYNSSFDGGTCFGFSAVLSCLRNNNGMKKYFPTIDSISDINESTVFVDNLTFRELIQIMHCSQATVDMVKMKSANKNNISGLINEIDNISPGDMNNIVIDVQKGTEAHALTPYSYNVDSNGLYYISLYDSNKPFSKDKIVVLPDLSGWTYKMGDDTWGGTLNTNINFITYRSGLLNDYMDIIQSADRKNKKVSLNCDKNGVIYSTMYISGNNINLETNNNSITLESGKITDEMIHNNIFPIIYDSVQNEEENINQFFLIPQNYSVTNNENEKYDIAYCLTDTAISANLSANAEITLNVSDDTPDDTYATVEGSSGDIISLSLEHDTLIDRDFTDIKFDGVMYDTLKIQETDDGMTVSGLKSGSFEITASDGTVTTKSVDNVPESATITAIVYSDNTGNVLIDDSSNSTLSKISVDGEELSDFASSETEYAVTLPYGTTAIPTVTATPANANSDVDIAQATSLTGTEAERTATITVTAEDGVTKTIYKVVFSIETHTHNLATEYSSDETGHWYECSDCDEKVDFEAHTEDSGMITTEPTETTEGVKTYKCTKCRYVLRTEAVPVITDDHTHNYEDDWKYDSNSHWHECACGDKTDIASHTSDGGTVTLAPSENSEGIITYKCNDCDCILRMETIPATTPEHTCSYGTNWKYDSTSHWHECSCGNKSDISRHISNGGIVTVQPTSTTTGVKTYSCSVCGYTMRTEILPATGNNSENNYPTYPGYPTYPDYPTYPTNPTYTVSTTPSPNIFTEKLTVNSQTKSDTITLKWDEIKGADKYLVYYYKDGKYVKVKTTEDTSVTFRKLKNGKTYKFRVRYTINGKLSPISYSCEYTVTVYYKPIAKSTATQNSVRLSWKKVPGAEKYAVYKYVDGKAVKLCETKKLAVKIKKLKPNKEYKYIVRAYVNGKWTTMTKSDIVTVTTE